MIPKTQCFVNNVCVCACVDLLFDLTYSSSGEMNFSSLRYVFTYVGFLCTGVFGIWLELIILAK